MYRIYYQIDNYYYNYDNRLTHDVDQIDYISADSVEELKFAIDQFVVEFSVKEHNSRIDLNYLLDLDNSSIDAMLSSIKAGHDIDLSEYRKLEFITPIMLVIDNEHDYQPIDSEKITNNMIANKLVLQRENNQKAEEDVTKNAMEKERELYEELKKKFEN